MTATIIAQQTGGLPDSVTLGDSIHSTENVVHQADSSVNSSSDDKKSEKEEQLVSRIVPDSVVYTAKRDKDFEYANDPAYWIKKKKEIKEDSADNNFAGNKWLRAAIFLVISAILLFAFYKIVIENRMYMFYSSSRARAVSTELEPRLEEEDLDQKIAESLKANDLRSGIRFMYLKVLKKSGEQGLFQFRQHATNQDYIQEIKDPVLRSQFSVLTNIFEYTWYGGFAIAPERFERVQKQFEHFYKSISQ